MSYGSVDTLQQALTQDVFHYSKDAKKAAGRALGTLVEIIAFYLIKSWKYEQSVVIERRLAEYANSAITHNVEFSLHPSRGLSVLEIEKTHLPLTPKKILKKFGSPPWSVRESRTTSLLSSDKVLRNACVLYEDTTKLIVANLRNVIPSGYQVAVNELIPHPYAVVECKRVGVEEGVKKGPQTIEKAKQGAYVARTVSSLQKIRMNDGSAYGIIHLDSGELRYEPYELLLRDVIDSNEPSLLRDFTLTVGIVSNHGNWFSSNDHNKELRVLAQSYDWLLFLNDAGLSLFVESLLLKPDTQYIAIREAFIQSYSGQKGGNVFTKVKISLEADLALREYFHKNLSAIERWFSVISPSNRSLAQLNDELAKLSSKRWWDILGYDCR